MPLILSPDVSTIDDIQVETDVLTLYKGNTLNIEGWDRLHPGESYTLEIRRRRTEEVRDPMRDPIADSTPVKLDSDGFFHQAWEMPSVIAYESPKYRYYPKLVYTGDTTRYAVPTKDIKVLNRAYGLVDRMEDFLGSLLDIHIYDLKSKDSNTVDRTDFAFTYGKWRDDKPIRVYIANESGEFYQTNYTVDYDNGIVSFPTQVPSYEDVYASFVFGLYSTEELRTFITQSIQELNYTRPVSNFNAESIPYYWEPFVLAGATLKALTRMRTEAMFKERLFLFSSASYVQQLSAYEADLSKKFEYAQSNKNRWGLTSPRAITGFDVVTPPRVTPQNYASMAYLRGRAL